MTGPVQKEPCSINRRGIGIFVTTAMIRKVMIDVCSPWSIEGTCPWRAIVTTTPYLKPPVHEANIASAVYGLCAHYCSVASTAVLRMRFGLAPLQSTAQQLHRYFQNRLERYPNRRVCSKPGDQESLVIMGDCAKLQRFTRTWSRGFYFALGFHDGY